MAIFFFFLSFRSSRTKQRNEIRVVRFLDIGVKNRRVCSLTSELFFINLYT